MADRIAGEHHQRRILPHAAIEQRLRHRIGLPVRLAIGDVAPVARAPIGHGNALANEIAFGVKGRLFLEQVGDGAVHRAQRMTGTYVDGPVIFPRYIHRCRFHRQRLKRRKIGFHLNIHRLIPPDCEPHFAFVIICIFPFALV